MELQKHKNIQTPAKVKQLFYKIGMSKIKPVDFNQKTRSPPDMQLSHGLKLISEQSAKYISTLLKTANQRAILLRRQTWYR
jgi:hypothetical protein